MVMRVARLNAIRMTSPKAVWRVGHHLEAPFQSAMAWRQQQLDQILADRPAPQPPFAVLLA
jgi:hypothetical protein